MKDSTFTAAAVVILFAAGLLYMMASSLNPNTEWSAFNTDRVDYSVQQMHDTKERECEADVRCSSYDRSTGTWYWKAGMVPPIIIRLDQPVAVEMPLINNAR